tara:strand:- start:325 stop:630 length:306 start_codon:yes stop_codon:yes gene_type:complete
MYEILHELLEKSYLVSASTKNPAGFGFILIMLAIIITAGITITQVAIQIKNIFELFSKVRIRANERQIEIAKSVKLTTIINMNDEILDKLHKMEQDGTKEG